MNTTTQHTPPHYANCPDALAAAHAHLETRDARIAELEAALRGLVNEFDGYMADHGQLDGDNVSKPLAIARAACGIN